MERNFTDTYVEKKEEIIQRIVDGLFEQGDDPVGLSYKQVLTLALTYHPEVNEYDGPDLDRIHVINDGEYQGMLLFVIGAHGYQPSLYWSTNVSYGSCSGCDTLQHLEEKISQGMWDYEADEYVEYSSEQLKENYRKYAEGIYTLGLHMMQKIRDITTEV